VAAQEAKLYQLISTTAGGLVQMAYRYRDVPILAFDDFDLALRQEATANIVKQLIAPEPIRRVTHQTVTAINNQHRKSGPKEYIAPPAFNVRCGLVMLTNVDVADPKAIGKDMREHVKALHDRGLEFVHVSRKPEHIADYVICLATEGGLLEKAGMTLSSPALDDVVRFFRDNMYRFATLSVRRFQSIARDRMTMPERWQALQEASFLPDVRANLRPAMAARAATRRKPTVQNTGESR
jgi:hypothetical protein